MKEIVDGKEWEAYWIKGTAKIGIRGNFPPPPKTEILYGDIEWIS